MEAWQVIRQRVWEKVTTQAIETYQPFGANTWETLSKGHFVKWRVSGIGQRLQRVGVDLVNEKKTCLRSWDIDVGEDMQTYII